MQCQVMETLPGATFMVAGANKTRILLHGCHPEATLHGESRINPDIRQMCRSPRFVLMGVPVRRKAELPQMAAMTPDQDDVGAGEHVRVVDSLRGDDSAGSTQQAQ